MGRYFRLLNVLCAVYVAASATHCSLVQTSPTECDVSACYLETSTTTRSGPMWTTAPQNKRSSQHHWYPCILPSLVKYCNITCSLRTKPGCSLLRKCQGEDLSVR